MSHFSPREAVKRIKKSLLSSCSRWSADPPLTAQVRHVDTTVQGEMYCSSNPGAFGVVTKMLGQSLTLSISTHLQPGDLVNPVPGP